MSSPYPEKPDGDAVGVRVVPSSPASSYELGEAVKRIKPVDDLKNLPNVQCARESLMYGIASGTAIGATRMLNSNIKVASNWAVGTFIFVSGAAWYICRSAYAKEQAFVGEIATKYPERNVRTALERAEERRRQEDERRRKAAEHRASWADDTAAGNPSASALTPALPPPNDNAESLPPSSNNSTSTKGSWGGWFGRS